MATKIEYVDTSWNPIPGCSKISVGCKNCFAEKMAKRLVGMGQENYYPVVDLRGWTGRTHLIESALEKPHKWKKPLAIFVCSMGDLFHESTPFEWIDEVFDTMSSVPRHTYKILTKRPQRMAEYFKHLDQRIADAGFEGYDPPSFIWLGVTAENQEQADKRIPILLQIPAAKRFVSIEPMLGPMDIEIYLNDGALCLETPQPALDWVICGAESGPGRRPMNKEWVRSLKEQCVSANIPFFFKQMYEGNKKVKMPLFEGEVWDQSPI